MQIRGDHSTIRALTGLIKLVGPVEGPPMHAPDFQTGILAGLWGFIATASSVWAACRTVAVALVA